MLKQVDQNAAIRSDGRTMNKGKQIHNLLKTISQKKSISKLGKNQYPEIAGQRI